MAHKKFNMLKSYDVRSVHLEVTDKCNASCPMCARNINGGKLNPNLRMIEMSLAEAKKVFSSEFLRQLNFIQLCGNFGDPIAAQDTLEILHYFRSENPRIGLGLHTNGGLRRPEWWAQMGALLKESGDYCKFGLDGLADTNHIYRRNTRWDKIMSNVQSFTKAGGVAHWEFLVFRHNEHQVEEARQMAKEMGFREFFVKKTSRFFDYKLGVNVPFPIHDSSGETIGFLEPPTTEEFVNPVSQLEKGPNPLLTAFKSVDQYLSKTTVNCMSATDKSIYITARGEVYPCCFLGGQVRYSEPGTDGRNIEYIVERTKKDAAGISAIQNPISDVIDKDWFSAIKDNWSLPAEAPEAVVTCRRICGQTLRLVGGEYR